MRNKPQQKQKDNKRVFLTGGHAVTTALAVVGELNSRKGWDIFWVGVKYAFEGSKTPSIEARVFNNKQYGVNFIPITTGRFQRKYTIWTIPSLLKIPIGFIQSLFLIARLKPHIVLSFGGFASYPVVIAAWIWRIPIVLHEQTMAAGRANIKSAKFATKIVLARNESKTYFPNEKCVVLGNPVSKSVLNVKVKEKLSEIPTIFITGGSRGAQVINRCVETVLSDIIKDFNVIHQTGQLDYEKFLSIRKSLSVKTRKRYKVVEFIKPESMSDYYEVADLVISRAGANTVSEILSVKRPTILIPIPWTYLNEQQKNAEYAQHFGLGTIINQDKLTSESLLNNINKIFDNWYEIIAKVQNKKSPDISATEKVVDLIEELLR